MDIVKPVGIFIWRLNVVPLTGNIKLPHLFHTLILKFWKIIIKNRYTMGIIAKKKKWTLTIQEGLPDDIYKQAAQALGEGIINDDFSAFESMLDDNVRWEWAKESRSPIIGRNEVIGYWKDWVKRVTHDKLDVEFEVKFCTFYSRTTLAISPKGYATAYVLFYIENGLIKLGVFVGRIIDRINLFGKADKKWEETLDHFPLALQDKDINEISKQEARGNRMPCLNC